MSTSASTLRHQELNLEILLNDSQDPLLWRMRQTVGQTAVAILTATGLAVTGAIGVKILFERAVAPHLSAVFSSGASPDSGEQGQAPANEANEISASHEGSHESQDGKPILAQGEPSGAEAHAFDAKKKKKQSATAASPAQPTAAVAVPAEPVKQTAAIEPAKATDGEPQVEMKRCDRILSRGVATEKEVGLVSMTRSRVVMNGCTVILGSELPNGERIVNIDPENRLVTTNRRNLWITD